MALFDDKIPPLKQLLSEPLILRLLQLLVQDVICLTAGQVHQVLRASPSPGQRRYFHELVRDVLHKLEEGQYLGSTSVKHLPPATVGNAPLFRLEKYDTTRLKSQYAELERGWVPPTPEDLAAFTFGDEPVYHLNDMSDAVKYPPIADLSRYAGLAKRRLPAIETHRDTRLYFTTPKAADFLCSEQPFSAAWYQYGLDDRSAGNRAERLIEAHRVVEGIAEASPQEIACTELTAVFNLNQFMLSGCFQLKIATGEWRYRSLGNLEGTKQCGEISVKDRGKVSLFFLRPLLPDELKALILSWWGRGSFFSECWCI